MLRGSFRTLFSDPLLEVISDLFNGHLEPGYMPQLLQTGEKLAGTLEKTVVSKISTLLSIAAVLCTPPSQKEGGGPQGLTGKKATPNPTTRWSFAPKISAHALGSLFETF